MAFFLLTLTYTNVKRKNILWRENINNCAILRQGKSYFFPPTRSCPTPQSVMKKYIYLLISLGKKSSIDLSCSSIYLRTI